MAASRPAGIISSPASAEQAMMEQFYQGVKTYVDEHVAEVMAERQITLDLAELESRFNAHPVNEQGMDLINASRKAVMDLAFVWLNVLPPGRDKSLAYTALEEASYHATAAIARQKGNQT
jgi:hypothetical protein